MPKDQTGQVVPVTSMPEYFKKHVIADEVLCFCVFQTEYNVWVKCFLVANYQSAYHGKVVIGCECNYDVTQCCKYFGELSVHLYYYYHISLCFCSPSGRAFSEESQSASSLVSV